MASRIIVVQGPPGVGKSTFARRLAGDIGIGVIAKDDIKELLFDKYEHPSNREESTVLGRIALTAFYAALAAVVKEGKDAIAESAYVTEYAREDIAQLTSHGATFFQLYCTTSQEVWSQRLTDRIEKGERHAGHHDTLTHGFDFARQRSVYGPLPIEPTINVDLTALDDNVYKRVLLQVQNEFLNTDD